ncbi:MAG: twin-arginine translocase subunit TatC [Bacteroidota bacterium]|nr:twin-arginine translocase subunit TatC [Bacteroidota bacterium]
MKKNSLGEMSFLDHLEALRWLLIRSTAGVLVGALISFLFINDIFDVIIFGPSRPEFITYRWLCDISIMVDTWRGAEEVGQFCIEKLNFEIQSRKLTGQFSVMLWMGITCGFILGFPYILWEVWKFIRPALYKEEKKNAKLFIFTASLMFFLGVLFGYYVLTPLSVQFLGNYSVSSTIQNKFDIESYIGTVKTCILAAGLVFELPVLMLLLGKMGLVEPSMLRKYRKIAVVLIMVIASIITPPDVLSLIIISIPFVLLYEISIYLVQWSTKK